MLRCAPFFLALALGAQTRGLVSSDLYKLRFIGDVAFSPDGTKLAYTVTLNSEPGRPFNQLFVRTVATGAIVRIGGDADRSAGPRWSPDGQWIAFSGKRGDQNGLFVARPDGSGTKFVHKLGFTNSPLTFVGQSYTWSPDGKQIALVHSTPGPETAEATGDPVVITRYLYKPDADEGNSRFNDNLRPHIYIADVASGQVRQLTDGVFYEHSIDWSPKGDEIAFISNREPDQDFFHNYDIFAVRVTDGKIRRITATESCEYMPLWSPDGRRILYQGTKRGLTDLETTMEDNHLWIVNADGTGRREITGDVDNRQGRHSWAGGGDTVYFTVQERGSVRLYRKTIDGKAEAVIRETGTVAAYSVAKNGALAYAFLGTRDLAQLFLRSGGSTAQLTDLNAEVLRGKEVAEVESFTFVSNDNQYEIEAFLTKPVGLDPDRKYPMIVNIHGGPHGQQGPAFVVQNQVYAAQGFATLHVNYRGSTGYGQKFADLVFGDQNGNEAMDVLYGTSAALRRYLWIDRQRLGVEGVSYGGQLSFWLITQTPIFKAAIPVAGISNLISYNYMTYYNQYEEMEFGKRPHQGNLMDVLWERSALKHVAKARTPTMIVHGENDNDVPIAEAEQMYIALKDVGVETIFVRYPREGHGLREIKHRVDYMDRALAWYRKHFK